MARLSPPDAAPRAIETLQVYDVVLLTERLDDDSRLLDQMLNGQPFGATARLNTAELNRGDSEGPFPERYAAAFDERFPYERQVFDAARALYPESHEFLQSAADDGAARPRVVVPPRSPLFSLDWEAPTRCGGFSDRLGAIGRLQRPRCAPRRGRRGRR